MIDPWVGTGIMLAASAVGLWATWYFGWDVHRSEGKAADRAADVLSLRARDKRLHFVVAALLAFAGRLLLRTPWGIAAAIALLAGVALEVIQKNPRDRVTKGGGYASWKDMVADALGAFLGAALAALVGLMIGR
jgi:hypothetical protein